MRSPGSLVDPSRSFHTSSRVVCRMSAADDLRMLPEGSTTKVGNILNLEGGIGADFLGGGLTAGLAYYGTSKLSDDRFDSQAANLLIRGRNQVWGLGPEVTVAIASGKKVYGFATVRYQWEIAGRTTTEGSAWNLSFVFPLKPIQIP